MKASNNENRKNIQTILYSAFGHSELPYKRVVPVMKFDKATNYIEYNFTGLKN